MNVSSETFFAKAKSLTNKVFAIEASWDGDSSGWCVVLDAVILKENDIFGTSNLGYICHGLGEFHDFQRALTGQAPPYEEAVIAMKIGQEIATYLKVPFYFPSPNKPALLEVPRWVDFQASRVSSIPIGLINSYEIIEFFKHSKLLVVEAYWTYLCRFRPSLAIHTSIHDADLAERPNLSATGRLDLGNFRTEIEFVKRFIKDGKPSISKEYKIGFLDWDDVDSGKIIHGKSIPNSSPVDEMVRIGNTIANHFGVSFYFPSPEKPAHRLPRWIETQDKNK
jgi:hypothetical protein